MNISKQSMKLYQKASDELLMINQTLKNSELDHMSFLVCQSVKECMTDFLNCFLLIKKGERSHSKNLNDLVVECSAIDEQFKQLDLRWLSCGNHDFKKAGNVFCSSAQHTQVCIWIANGIKKVLDDEIKKQSSPLLPL